MSASKTRLGLRHLHAAAPSESKDSRLKATVEDELEEEDEEEEDSPVSSESVRRAGGSGSRGLGKSQPFSFSSRSSVERSLGPFAVAARGGNSE